MFQRVNTAFVLNYDTHTCLRMMSKIKMD